jgi:hypothetical protein
VAILVKDASAPPELRALRSEIEAHRRQAGYYLLRLVEISDLRAQESDEEALLDRLFEHFDDEPWPPPDQRPQDQTWNEYAVDRATARSAVTAALVGGPDVGHGRLTIPRARAESYFDRFEALFEEPRRYFVGMGLGDQRYSSQQGAAIVSAARAGLLWVVESD